MSGRDLCRSKRSSHENDSKTSTLGSEPRLEQSEEGSRTLLLTSLQGYHGTSVRARKCLLGRQRYLDIAHSSRIRNSTHMSKSMP